MSKEYSFPRISTENMMTQFCPLNSVKALDDVVPALHFKKLETIGTYKKKKKHF